MYILKQKLNLPGKKKCSYKNIRVLKLSSLTSSFLETRVGRFGSTFLISFPNDTIHRIFFEKIPWSYVTQNDIISRCPTIFKLRHCLIQPSLQIICSNHLKRLHLSNNLSCVIPKVFQRESVHTYFVRMLYTTSRSFCLVISFKSYFFLFSRYPTLTIMQ